MRISDWISDVCSSDLLAARRVPAAGAADDGHLAQPQAAGAVRLAQDRLHVVRGDARGVEADLGQRLGLEAVLRVPGVERAGFLAALLDLGAIESLRPGAAGADVEHRARRRRSEEHTSELPSLMRISYAVFCLKTT